jgi:putative membrane protein
MTLKNILALTSLLIFSIGTAVISAADFPSDEQITKILTTTNDGEISMAKLAEKKAENKDVKKFAKEMVKDHGKNNKKTMKLSKKMDMAPEENQKAGELRSESEKNMASLQNLSGKEFDKAYMSMQVQAHQKVLNDLDTTLIPGAKNEKLKKQLEKTRSTVAEHLDKAKEISQKL